MQAFICFLLISLPFFLLPFKTLPIIFAVLFLLSNCHSFLKKESLSSWITIMQIGCFISMTCYVYLKHGILPGLAVTLAGIVITLLCEARSAKKADKAASKILPPVPSSLPDRQFNTDVSLTMSAYKKPYWQQNGNGLKIKGVILTQLSAPFSYQSITEILKYQQINARDNDFTEAWKYQFITLLHRTINPAGTWLAPLPIENKITNADLYQHLYAVETNKGEYGLHFQNLYFTFPKTLFTHIRLTEFTCRGDYWYTLDLENHSDDSIHQCHIEPGSDDKVELYFFIIQLANAWDLRIILDNMNMN